MAKSKGIQLDEKDDAWELKKEELLKSKPFSPEKHVKQTQEARKGGCAFKKTMKRMTRGSQLP